MFRLVRFFFITSSVAVAAIVAMLVLYRHHEITQLIAFAEGQNVTLARSFANTIWPRFADHVRGTSQLNEQDLAALPAHRKTSEIREALRAISAGLPVLKVKIYSLEGLTVYSSVLSEIGEDKSNNPGFFAAARDGTPASRLTFRDTFSTFEGKLLNRDLVESYLPIRQGDGAVEGVFELYTDVTSLLARVRESTLNLAVGTALVFGFLYGALFLVVRRADRTIKRQYADIVEKNEDLQREILDRQRAEAALKEAQDELEQRVEARTRDLSDEIAERERAEDEARQHRKELAQIGAVITMGEMATTLAHELNQPLTVISGSAQFCLDRLRSGTGEREQLLDSVEQVAEQAERANEIVRRVRGFIRKQEPESRAADLNDIIHDIADLLHFDAREHGAALELDLAVPLPQVILDPIQIQQVILNLAHNAMEAMNAVKPSQRRLDIRTSEGPSGVVQVAVHDQGHGIAPEALEKVFDPFFTTRTDGLGMGLAISRSIIEAHGGRLWVTSDGETQTVFRFTLPIAKDTGSNDG